MAQIEEEYVGFECAKLLKEKGFSEKTIPFYKGDGSFCSRNGNVCQPWDWNRDKFVYYSAPTQQMAMRWLREVHNLCIEPYRNASGYLYTISKIWTGSVLYSDEYNGDDEASGQWTTWEKAVEAAIKYCLENLIK